MNRLLLLLACASLALLSACGGAQDDQQDGPMPRTTMRPELMRVSSTNRDPAQVRAFRKLHACPGGPDKGSHTRCRGYVVDHKIALDCGGPDRPSNMQYQTIAAGKAKDKIERNGPNCKHRTHGVRT